MLSGIYRFHGHGSLNYLFRNNHAVRSQWFIVRHVENKRRKNSRVAIIVSKKVAKSAVTRNRIRRRIYEIIRRNWGGLPQQIDIAIIVLSAETATVSAQELEQAMSSVLYKAQLYRRAT